MTDPGELVSGLFSVVVTLFLLVVLLKAFSGDDISRLVSAFADFMPGFLVFLIVLFIVAWGAQIVS